MKPIGSRLLQYFIISLFVFITIGCTKTNGVTQAESIAATHSSIIYNGSEIDELSFENIAKSVSDDYQYFGLSVYLGGVIPVAIDENGSAFKIKLEKEKPTLVVEEWVGFRGRFETVLIHTKNANVYLEETGIILDWQDNQVRTLKVFKGRQDEFIKSSDSLPNISQLQYIHLPKPIQYICRLFEWLLKTIVSLPLIGFGLGIFIFAVFVRLLMWPIFSATQRAQNNVDKHRVHLAPIHSNIKKTLKGEKAHNALMKSYKDIGITPYYTLKPLLFTMLALPVLIAIFNMLGEVFALKASGFLWVDSLAYPDHVTNLPFIIPFFGNRLNLLPFLMTAITIISAKFPRNSDLLKSDIKRQKRNLYFMAIAFFLLFYNFPSGMILYWTIASVLGVLLSNYSTFKITPSNK